MARGIVVKVWNVKAGSKTRSAKAQISDSIAYIENPEKTGKALDIPDANNLGNELKYVTNDIKTVSGLYVGGRHITDISMAAEEMMQVKNFYGKTDGRVATHGVISLDESESQAENAGKLMLLLNDLMEEVFPDNQAVFAVHTNTENLHIHFILNTVGLDGKKIHMDRAFMGRVLEPAVNRLAEKYGFTPNENWKKTKKEDPLSYVERKIILRKLVDEAIEQTDSFEAFIAYLRSAGLTVNVGKNISLQDGGMPKAMRTGTLGENYTAGAIRKRIDSKYDPFVRGEAHSYYEEILPEQMMQIVPLKMKKYKDMTSDEKHEAVRLLRLKRNPWREAANDNWQMQRMSDELTQIGYVYRLTHYYSGGTDSAKDAMDEILERRKKLSAEKKQLRQMLKDYKPVISIYEEMKTHMARAWLYDSYGMTEFEDDFNKYRELSERLKKSYGKTVEEVADYVAETKAEILYLKGQEAELSKQYLAIKKYADAGLKKLAEEYSFFHAVGHSEALYNARHYGICESSLKYIRPDSDSGITVRVMTVPDAKDGRTAVATTVTVMDSAGNTVREVSSKDMTEKEFNRALYGIQSDYGLGKCTVSRSRNETKQKNIQSPDHDRR